jgi:hypothetical protein
MRRTINIDDDVAEGIQSLRREQGIGLSEAVNLLARAGLRHGRTRALFRQREAKIGLIVDVGNIADKLESLYGPRAR